MDLDDAKTSNSGDRTPDVGDLVDVFKFPPKKWVTLRLRKGIFSTARYWIKTKNKQGKLTKFPTPCPSYDAETQERDSEKVDPWRDLQAAEYQKAQDGEVSKEEARENAKVQFEQKFWMQGIVRGLQRNEPAKKAKHTKTERETGFKDKDSDSWTPQRAVRLGKSFTEKLKKLKQLNVVEGRSGQTKAFAVNDDKYGCDIRVMYDPDAAPADQYQIQIGERTPLTEEELEYLGWDLATATEKAMAVPNDKEVMRDFESWASRNGIKIKKAGKKPTKDDDDGDGDDDTSDDDDPPPKKKPSSKKPSKKDDDDEPADDDGDDFDDEPKKKPSAKKPAPKKRPKDDDDGDGDGDDNSDGDDGDDFDDEPKKPSKKPAKKPAKDEDDGDDFDADDDGDGDDDPPPKKKPAPKKRPKDDDDGDDFDSDSMDDDDPPPKKKPAPKKPSKKDDDDGDGDDFDDDTTDDDDPPPKKKPQGKAGSGKKRPKDDDGDEDF